jgi:hypothetical protein
MRKPYEASLAVLFASATQFWVSLTIIERVDRMRFPEIYSYIVQQKSFWEWDMGVFGSLGLMLNIMALCFSGFAYTAKYTNPKHFPEFDIMSASRLLRVSTHISNGGEGLFGASFICLLLYIHPLYAIVALCLTLCLTAYFFVGIWALALYDYVRQRSNKPKA